MMHGTFNQDLFCRTLDQIFSERDDNVEVKVKLVSEEEAEAINKQKDNTI